MKHFYTLCFCLLTAALYAQPANNDCADAIAINEVTDLEFTTLDATTDGPFHPDSPCPSSSDLDSIYSDIWYAYTATFTGYCFWDICSTADFDTKIAVYKPGSACPPSDDDLLNCNEDAGNCDNFTSQLLFEVESGQTYLLRLGGFGEDTPGEQGSGTFSVEEFVPVRPNDFCADAIPVELGENQNLITNEATTDGPDHPNNPGCFGFGDITVQSDIWYLFTPDFTGSVEWSTCGTVSFDSRLAVYGPNVQCPVTDGDLYACNDDGAGCVSYTSKLIFDVEEGNTYILRVGGYGGETGTGTFNLINTEPPEPPANDLCGNAETVVVTDPGGTEEVTGTTINATYDSDNFTSPLCRDSESGEFAEVWYTFNSGGEEMLQLLFAGLTQDAFFYIDIWESCDGGPVDTLEVPTACLRYNEETVGTITLDTLGPLPPTPTDYVMRVATIVTFDPPGDFIFQLNRLETSSTSVPSFPGDISITPNPVSRILNLSIALDQPIDLNFTILDAAGRRVVLSEDMDQIQSSVSAAIDVSSLEAGVYFIHIVTQDGVGKTLRFIKV